MPVGGPDAFRLSERALAVPAPATGSGKFTMRLAAFEAAKAARTT